MRVTRITIDADLGLIELKTGPGGDGDYVLLPLAITSGLERYVSFDRPMEVTSNEEGNVMPWYSGVGEVEQDKVNNFDRPSTFPIDEPRRVIVSEGGWVQPAETAHLGPNPGDHLHDSEIEDPPTARRGGIKYSAKMTDAQAAEYDESWKEPETTEVQGTATVEEVAAALGHTLLIRCQFCHHMKEPNA